MNKPKKLSRVVFCFADGAEKCLESGELECWIERQLTMKPVALPMDENRIFRKLPSLDGETPSLLIWTRVEQAVRK